MMPKFEYRDICGALQKFREFLLGRPHNVNNMHARFTPCMASRTLPRPEIPRGPSKYSDQYYFQRCPMHSVKPPVVAPVALGPPPYSTNMSECGGMNPADIYFLCAPTPGCTWWWDGHCYYECVPDCPVTRPCC